SDLPNGMSGTFSTVEDVGGDNGPPAPAPNGIEGSPQKGQDPDPFYFPLPLRFVDQALKEDRYAQDQQVGGNIGFYQGPIEYLGEQVGPEHRPDHSGDHQFEEQFDVEVLEL